MENPFGDSVQTFQLCSFLFDSHVTEVRMLHTDV
jgi:hypothetical protein